MQSCHCYSHLYGFAGLSVPRLMWFHCIIMWKHHLAFQLLSKPWLFICTKGTDQQIQHAQQLIREKIESERGGRGGNYNQGQNWNQPGWNQQQQPQQQQQQQQGGWSQYGQYGQQQQQYGQQPQQQQPQQYGQQQQPQYGQQQAPQQQVRNF